MTYTQDQVFTYRTHSVYFVDRSYTFCIHRSYILCIDRNRMYFVYRLYTFCVQIIYILWITETLFEINKICSFVVHSKTCRHQPPPLFLPIQHNSRLSIRDHYDEWRPQPESRRGLGAFAVRCVQSLSDLMITITMHGGTSEEEDADPENAQELDNIQCTLANAVFLWVD